MATCIVTSPKGRPPSSWLVALCSQRSDLQPLALVEGVVLPSLSNSGSNLEPTHPEKMSAPQVPYPHQAPYPPPQPSFPQMPYDPPPPYNPQAGNDGYPQPGWISAPPAPQQPQPPQPQQPQATVFNPSAQGYVKQGSTYVPTGQPGMVPPTGYYPSGGQPGLPGGGYYNSTTQQPMPGGYYPGQPAPPPGGTQGYYGATGYPGANTVVVREQTQETSRMDDLAKCCLGTCCLTWFCCWLTD